MYFLARNLLELAKVNFSTWVMIMRSKLSALLLLFSEIALATANQSVADIQAEVEAFVQANLQGNLEYQVNVAPIDPRLQLPLCEQALSLFVQSGAIKPGQNTIGVRCPALRGWTIYSIVNLKAFREVLVSNKSIRRNEAIRPEHFMLEKREIGSLQQGFVSNPDEIIDSQALRDIAPGTVLTRQHYAALTVVRRGEQVNIQSARPGFLISAPGVALMDGARGQQIRVKNASSQRIVSAIVIDVGIVNVSF